VIATRDIRPGEEILAPYGGQCCKRLKKKLLANIAAKTEAEEKFRTMIEAQFYRTKGAAPRWHCTKCRKFVAKDKIRSHAALCQ
jgi:hypothetical protein